MKILHGISAAPGFVIGKAHRIQPMPVIDSNARSSHSAAEEIIRLEQATNAAIAHLEKLMQATTHETTTEILATQHEMLEDPELQEGALAEITQGLTAEAAITRTANGYAEQLAQQANPYLAARAEDIREVGRRIVAELLHINQDIHLDHQVILIAQDLAPAETVGLNTEHLQAIVTETGSATGHLAIVAQGLGIPAIVGVKAALEQIAEGTIIIADGSQGTIIIDPDESHLADAEKRLQEDIQKKHDLEIYHDRKGMTADNHHIEVFANIASLAEAKKAVEMGAEGVGLFRTELIATNGLPDEETQYRLYREIASILQRPLIVRTFDIGGDKAIPGLNIPTEMNPFLGWRGIRLGLDQPEKVFLPQIRALLRSASVCDLRIMLPMIATPQEVVEARHLIDQARADLEQAGETLAPIQIGIMVETPAAALTLDQFAGIIDFASIGTNDLVQYTYAVDRTNPHVQQRAQPLGLAILRLIERINQAGIPIAVCGQLAANEEAIPLLVGLGVRELSVAPTHIPAVKRILSSLTLEEMQQKAREALQ